MCTWPVNLESDHFRVNILAFDLTAGSRALSIV